MSSPERARAAAAAALARARREVSKMQRWATRARECGDATLLDDDAANATPRVGVVLDDSGSDFSVGR
jgi:hypothetical protein